MYQCLKWSGNHSVVPNSLQPHGLQSARLCPWNSPGHNTGVGNRSLSPGDFSQNRGRTQVSHTAGGNRWILYCLSHQESPRILEWVAYPFSSRCLQPRHQTGVSWIAGGFFTSWATREALVYNLYSVSKFTVLKMWPKCLWNPCCTTIKVGFGGMNYLN